MTWVAWVATVGALTLGIVIGIVTLPASPLPAFVIGIVIGLIVGAIAFVFAWFRQPSGDAKESVGDQVERLEWEIRAIDENLAVARNDAVSRNDVGMAVPGGKSWSGKSPKQQEKEVAAQAKVTRLEGERVAKEAKLDQLRK
jgi:hypothetical protein